MRAILAQIHYDRDRDSRDRAGRRQIDAHGTSQSQSAARERRDVSLAHRADVLRRSASTMSWSSSATRPTRSSPRSPGLAPAARFVTNPDYENGGQFSSLLRGLNAVDRPGVIAALVTLVDVPLVNAATVRAVIERYHQTHAPIVRPVRGQEHGHPVLIDRSLFDEVRRAEPVGRRQAGGPRACVRQRRCSGRR